MPASKVYEQGVQLEKHWNFNLLWKMDIKVWPFPVALPIHYFFSRFLELKEKSARTAETLLSMLTLIRGVLAEALSDRLSPSTLYCFQSTVYKQVVILSIRLK